MIPDDVWGTDGTGGNCEISTTSSFSSSSIAESICWEMENKNICRGKGKGMSVKHSLCFQGAWTCPTIPQ